MYNSVKNISNVDASDQTTSKSLCTALYSEKVNVMKSVSDMERAIPALPVVLYASGEPEHQIPPDCRPHTVGECWQIPSIHYCSALTLLHELLKKTN